MSKNIVCIFSSVLVLVVVGHFVNETRSHFVQQRNVSSLRQTVLSYISQPAFGVKDFLQQSNGVPAKLEMLNLDEDMAYFSVPADKYTTAVLERLTEKPAHTEFSHWEGEQQSVGSYVYSNPTRHFFRFPSDDLRVFPGVTIKVKFPSARYTVSLEELESILDGDVLYRGKRHFYTGETTSRGRLVTMSNMATQVAMKGEPSLSRLAKEILSADSSGSTTAQKLLNFVTTEIPYNYEELEWGGQVFKRPTEVLLSSTASCSGKATLYASLLEQVGVKYKLMYYPTHLTVFVEGVYDNHNGYGIRCGGKNYSLAEPTCPKFIIGETRLEKSFDLVRDALAVQDPGAGTLTLGAGGKPARWVIDS